MTHILCSFPNVNDCTSMYRGIGPMHALARSNPEICLNATQQLGWAILRGTDLAFFQRPAMDDVLNQLRYAKEYGKPIWVDYDDNLHQVPLCNPRFPTYGHPQIQHNVSQMIAMADVVTVTTEHLATSTRNVLRCFPAAPGHNLDPAKVHVIPNAYDSETIGRMPTIRPPREKLVAWRGSESHRKDLWCMTEQLAAVVEKNNDWRFEFIGEPFWGTIEALKKVSTPQTIGITPAMDPIRFFRYLSRLAPEVIIVPLEDQGFNRSKSNIAWLEGTMAGAVALAPAWEEWSKPGVVTYKDPEDFGAKLAAILRGEVDTGRLWNESREYILDSLMLEKVNTKRMRIIEQLTSLAGKSSPDQPAQCPRG